MSAPITTPLPTEPAMLTAYVQQFKFAMKQRLADAIKAETEAAIEAAAEAAAVDLRQGLRLHAQRTHGMVEDVAVYIVRGSAQKKVA